MYSRNTEIRHMAATDVFKLGQILEHLNSWKTLMAIIPKNFSTPRTSDAPKKYNSDHIRLIENASLRQCRTGAEILFDEWGTSGRERPTVGVLLELLQEAQLYRAADYVAQNFLNEPVPKRPQTGPAAPITIPNFDTEEIKEFDEIMEEVSYPGSSVLARNLDDPSNMNNHDFYEKLGHNRQKIDVEKSDMMKFSSNTIISRQLPNLSILDNDSGMKIQESIPNLSIFGKSSSDNNQSSSLQRRTVSTVTSSNSTTKSHQTTINGSTENYDTHEMLGSCNIPALSALQVDSNITIDDNSTELPNLSALNLEVKTHISQAAANIPLTPNTSFDSEDKDNHLHVPNLTRGLSDSDNNLTPDLSFLDQSSLDDSSLTNVTETSDDLSSFDTGARLNLSENNIPMLSILQK